MHTRRHFLKSAICGTGFLLGTGRFHLAEASEVGKAYSGWREGELDIHVIYTGLGESLFHIFPDGTSLLVDAGDWQMKNREPVPHLPNESRRAGEWISRYVQRVNPAGSNVDYMLLSHYHPDHAGMPQKGAEVTQGRGDDYSLSGLAHTGEFLHYTYAFDRGWPGDNLPVPVKETPTFTNFRKFVRWTMKEKGLQMSRFVPGLLDQIQLQKNRNSYDFHIRNLAANGEVWTGTGTETHNFLPNWNDPDPKENPLSLSFTIQYGPFRYYTGGDTSTAIKTPEGETVPIEAAVGRAAGPVDVCKVNHHASTDASSDEFIKAVQARTYFSTVWVKPQPHVPTIDRLMSQELYQGDRQLFPTWFPAEKQAEAAEKPWAGSVAGDCGHIVIKVFDSGKQYKVYYLTNEDESMTIKNVYGPFESTGTARAASLS